MNDQDGDWNYHLRILSNSARDSTDPASDPSVLQSVSIEQLCVSLDVQRNHPSFVICDECQWIIR